MKFHIYEIIILLGFAFFGGMTVMGEVAMRDIRRMQRHIRHLLRELGEDPDAGKKAFTNAARRVNTIRRRFNRKKGDNQ